jgi:ABC-2 type transport system ATP-binding protein
MADEMIRCEGLGRDFGPVRALISLDLLVNAGSVFGFLGRNGAGKTTAIRLMTGLARPTSGSAWIDGIQTTNGEYASKRLFGYLPEEPAFYKWMTPYDYLDYVGRLYDLAKEHRRQKIEELLELVGLEDSGERRIGGFSRGMRQRLGLAQALIHEPPVLFLDEPTSALDPAGRKEVLDLIDRLRGQTTVFLSSHILSDVERICDTIGVIHKGQLLLVSDRDELISHYSSPSVLIEFSQESPIEIDDFVNRLRNQAWIVAVQAEDHSVRVQVMEVSLAKRELMNLLSDYSQWLVKYEWVRPTLEDIFLSLSTSEDH